MQPQWAIILTGARHAGFRVEIDPVRRTLNPDKTRKRRSASRKSNYPHPVIYMEWPSEMARIMPLQEAPGCPVIEDDCAGARLKIRGRRAGQFGQLRLFSFYPSKTSEAYGEGLRFDHERRAITHRARSPKKRKRNSSAITRKAQNICNDEIG